MLVYNNEVNKKRIIKSAILKPIRRTISSANKSFLKSIGLKTRNRFFVLVFIEFFV